MPRTDAAAHLGRVRVVAVEDDLGEGVALDRLGADPQRGDVAAAEREQHEIGGKQLAAQRGIVRRDHDDRQVATTQLQRRRQRGAAPLVVVHDHGARGPHLPIGDGPRLMADIPIP